MYYIYDIGIKVISKGAIIHGSQQDHGHPTKSLTFSVPVSMDMAPTFKLLVTIVNPMGELVADSVTVPVRSINRYQVVYLILSLIFLDVLVVFELLLIFNSF